jgi:phosphoribosylformimino-5-aminoimidazole carboxamide ribonucleotide (ProFAR) isomerase
MDRIIFGDNQFFGINHMSEEKAQAQCERFKDVNAIIKVVDKAYECGIHAFMFNTHEKVALVCDHFRSLPDKYSDLRLYPSMPYAHKYANVVNEKGMVGALNDFVFADRSIGQAVTTLLRGGISIVNRDMIEIMKLLVDAEMRMFRGLNVQAVFLQNIVTDLLLGMKAKNVFIAFSEHIKKTYGVDAGFNSMNMPALVEFLKDCGIENPIICSSINKAGYLMSPNRESYEKTLQGNSFRPMAMSIMASGAVSPKEAIAYVTSFKNIKSIVFGASSGNHIQQTKDLIDSYWKDSQ